MKEIELAKNKFLENKRFFKSLNKKQIKTLDEMALSAHNQAFETFDCMKCANCCKSTGPLFTKADIERLSKLFKMKTSEFTSIYLRLDEDGDHVLQATPCPFLLENNECFVYDHRPKACREFPHTDRKNFYQIRNLTLKNTLICPIAFHVMENIKMKMAKT